MNTICNSLIGISKCILHSRMFRVIGQKELVKTAAYVDISMKTAVVSLLGKDTGWTKRVGKKSEKH